MRHAQLQDEVLSHIMAQCREHCPLDIANSYHELKSFDALLLAITQAEESGVPLCQMVEVMGRGE